MEFLIQLIERYDFNSIIVILILFIGSIIGIFEIVTKILQTLEKYRKNKNKIEDRNRAIDSRFDKIEQAEHEDKLQLNELSNELKEMKQLVIQIQKDQISANESQKKVNRAQARSAIFRLATEVVNRGYCSLDESETLESLTNVYMSSCSSSDNYGVPEIVKKALQIEILTLDEIQKRKVN